MDNREPKQQASNARYLARETGGDAVGNRVHWRAMGITRMQVVVRHDRVTILEGDGGYDLRPGLTWREIADHIDDLVMTRYEEKIAKREAYARLGGHDGAARRRSLRANANRGGWGDPALAKVTADILNELRDRRNGGQGIQQVLT